MHEAHALCPALLNVPGEPDQTEASIVRGQLSFLEDDIVHTSRLAGPDLQGVHCETEERLVSGEKVPAGQGFCVDVQLERDEKTRRRDGLGHRKRGKIKERSVARHAAHHARQAATTWTHLCSGQ